VKDVKVRAKLPDYVSLTGKIFPEEMLSKFSFDPISREVVWSVGNLEKGKGVFDSPLSIAFQVALVPTDSQRGETPEIIKEVEISGEDTFTGKFLQATSTSITTALPDDPQIKPEMGIVQ
jgi:hypothetical protein